MYALHITITDTPRYRHLNSMYNVLKRGEKQKKWRLNKVVHKNKALQDYKSKALQAIVSFKYTSNTVACFFHLLP